MKITGLPAYPRGKIRLDKAPVKKGRCTRKTSNGLTVLFENRYPIQVTNPKGKRASVMIVETMYPGFTVRLYNKPYTVLGYGYRNAEKLAIRLAMRGHRNVYNY